MKQSPGTTPPEKQSPTFLLAGLLILVVALASFAAIRFMEAQKIPTLENDTAWLESYFEGEPPRTLSDQQKQIIHKSAAITTAVAKDAGVTVTLQAVCGNGYNAFYKVELELPESLTAGQSCFFEKHNLQLNDNTIGLGSSRGGIQCLEDDNPTDHRYSLLIRTGLEYYLGLTYAFNNGIVRTLHLENIRIEGESGQPSKVIEGNWDLGVLFQDEGKVLELLQDPVLVRGFDVWRGTYSEAEITSVSLTEFSLYCQYRMMPNSKNSTLGLNAVIILKDGRTVSMRFSGGGGTEYHWDMRVPVSLNEVAFVKLSDEVVLPIQ